MKCSAPWHEPIPNRCGVKPAADRPAATVLGTGIDLVEVDRMQAALHRRGPRLMQRILLPEEQRYCEAAAGPPTRLAARFAAKEAVAKALAVGIGAHLGWRDICVTRDPRSGAPRIRLNARGRRLARARGVTDIHISLSHTARYATAVCVVTGHPAGPGV